jgi:GT2 family glycosyltransferase
MGDTSLVIVNFGSPELVQRLLRSLSAHGDRELVREVVVVDNGYPEKGDSRDAIDPSHYPFPVSFAQNEARSYASGCNRGVAATSSEFVAISNNDVEWIDAVCLGPLLEALVEDDQVFTVGPQLTYPDGRWQRSYRDFPSVGRALTGLVFWESLWNAIAAWRFSRGRTATRPRAVPYVHGAFMLFRRKYFDALGGFDERYHFYGDEVDLCWRARQAGLKRVTVPRARLVHLGGATATAVAPVEFSRRQFAAGCAFMARNFGQSRAKIFDAIQRIGAWERAVVYQIIATLIRTPSWKQRAAAATATARAALRPTSWESGW